MAILISLSVSFLDDFHDLDRELKQWIKIAQYLDNTANQFFS